MCNGETAGRRGKNLNITVVRHKLAWTLSQNMMLHVVLQFIDIVDLYIPETVFAFN